MSIIAKYQHVCLVYLGWRCVYIQLIAHDKHPWAVLYTQLTCIQQTTLNNQDVCLPLINPLASLLYSLERQKGIVLLPSAMATPTRVQWTWKMYYSSRIWPMTCIVYMHTVSLLNYNCNEGRREEECMCCSACVIISIHDPLRNPMAV